jgi:pimeloyl-ACP methyl ester carboxylesterase
MPYLDRFTAHFRVVAPDTRGHGGTVNPDGPPDYQVLAADAFALMDTLGMDSPILCGFSDGAILASVMALLRPDLPCALALHAGYDLFNPDAASMRMWRAITGGSENASGPDQVHLEREHAGWVEQMRSDHDVLQGEGAWMGVMRDVWDRFTSDAGFSHADFSAITCPTLLSVGDRDPFCPVEEAVQIFRQLPAGELAIMPGMPHSLSPALVELIADFLTRQLQTTG